VTYASPEPPPVEPSEEPYRRPWEPLGYTGPSAYPVNLDYPLDRPARRRPLWRGPLIALSVAAAATLTGFPLGLLWNALAPHVPALMTDQGPVYADPEGEQTIGVEGTYVFLTLGAGLVLAILAWMLLHRTRGVAVLLGLALGGVGGGVLTWWYGHSLGQRSAPLGVRFPAPVNLRVRQVGLWHHWLPYARGDVLFLALAAVLMYVLLAGFSAYPSLRKPTPQEVREEQLRAAESVRAVGDGQLGQGYGYRPDPAQESDLPAQQGPLGP
jgi:hypothetical protein